MDSNTTQQQIPAQQGEPQKQNITMVLTILVFVLFGVASYFGYQNYQLKQQISQIELSRVPQVSPSPTVTPSPTMGEISDIKAVKANHGSTIVVYEPPLSNPDFVSERNMIEQKVVAPYLDYGRDTYGEGYVVSLLLSLQKNETIQTQYPYQLIAITRTGVQYNSSSNSQLGLPDYTAKSGSILNSVMVIPLFFGLMGGILGFIVFKLMHVK